MAPEGLASGAFSRTKRFALPKSSFENRTMEIAKTLSTRRIPDRRQIEWMIGILITVAAVYLHRVNFRSAGALWRDEAGVVRIATLPTLPEMWSNLGHESCPILFPALLHTWSSLVGSSDTAFRVFGFVVGLLLLGAVWLNGWLFHRSAPLVALSLLALNASVVRWADSLRAYGLASVLMLLALAIGWRFARKPKLKWLLVASLVAVISVQCLFQNSFLLLAVCAAAAAVRVRRRDFKNALIALTIGMPAAVSLLPYGAMIRGAQGWSVLSQIGFVPPLIWTNLSLALAPTLGWLRWIWIALAVFAIARCVIHIFPDAVEDDADAAAFFAGTALIAGLIAFFVFLWVAKMPTQVWYFPPLTDHRFHRYDLLKAKMVLENPAQPVFDQVAATLRAGNRVWLVGDIPLSQTPSPQIQPAPNNPWGWLDDPYSDVWGAQVGYFVAIHATEGEVVPIPSSNPVSPLENVQVVSVAGWQETSAAHGD